MMTGVVLHRTYGSWPGDYAVISRGGLCHLLIGKDEGQWVQFDGLDGLQYHCGSNWWGWAVEFSGVNEEPLTEWQIRAGGYVIRKGAELTNIPLVYDDGQSGWTPTPVYGFHAHAGVVPDGGGSQHTNTITNQDWARLIGVPPSAPSPTPTPTPEEDDMAQFVFTDGSDWWWVVSAEGKRVLSPGEPQLLVDLGIVKPERDAKGNIAPKYVPVQALGAVPDMAIAGNGGGAVAAGGALSDAAVETAVTKVINKTVLTTK